MQVKELVTFYINEMSKTLDVSFRMEIDSEDEIRNDSILIEEVKNFGYEFLNEEKMDLYEDENYEDLLNDFEDEIVDENEVLSFLNEYYMINENKLPSAELF